jgi:hypothetical protein
MPPSGGFFMSEIYSNIPSLNLTLVIFEADDYNRALKEKRKEYVISQSFERQAT